MTHGEHSSQSGAKKRKRKDSGDGHFDYPDVALEQLQMNSLRRYKRHYKLQTRQGLAKTQLAEAVCRHFRSIPLHEKEVLAYFIYMVKLERNRVDGKDSALHNHSDDDRTDKIN